MEELDFELTKNWNKEICCIQHAVVNEGHYVIRTNIKIKKWVTWDNFDFIVVIPQQELDLYAKFVLYPFGGDKAVSTFIKDVNIAKEYSLLENTIVDGIDLCITVNKKIIEVRFEVIQPSDRGF